MSDDGIKVAIVGGDHDGLEIGRIVGHVDSLLRRALETVEVQGQVDLVALSRAWLDILDRVTEGDEDEAPADAPAPGPSRISGWIQPLMVEGEVYRVILHVRPPGMPSVAVVDERYAPATGFNGRSPADAVCQALAEIDRRFKAATPPEPEPGEGSEPEGGS